MHARAQSPPRRRAARACRCCRSQRNLDSASPSIATLVFLVCARSARAAEVCAQFAERVCCVECNTLRTPRPPHIPCQTSTMWPRHRLHTPVFLPVLPALANMLRLASLLRRALSALDNDLYYPNLPERGSQMDPPHAQP
jgi:hypothetical protein